jgi:hypothetical protein
MRELFVYYRVRAGAEAQALDIVDAFQARLRQSIPHLEARLLCRSDASGAAQTWMETYAIDGGPRSEGITPQDQQTIEAAATALASCIEGSRHAETFVPATGDQSANGRTIST